MLKQFLARRYNAEAHLLNLEVCVAACPLLGGSSADRKRDDQNMADDPTFKGPNALTAPGVRTGQKSSAALAMWKIIREQYPDVRYPASAHVLTHVSFLQVVSLSLADNNLISLVDIAPAALVHALPNLQNLSLKGNSIKEVKALNPLSHDDAIGRDGLQCLRELVIDDTPLWKQNVEGNSMEKLKRQIALRFPTLSVFTGLELTPTAEPRPKAPPSATPLGSGLKKVAEFPVSMKPGYTDESKEVVGPFLTQFVSL